MIKAAACAAVALVFGSPVLRAEASGPALAVVSQGSGTVAEIDAERGQIARSFGAGRSPAGIAAAPDGGSIYLAYPDGRSIGVFDTRSGRLVRSLAYDGQPFGIAADEAALYVSDWTKNIVAKLDPVFGKVIATAPVGKSPAGIVLDPSAQRLYVADRESDDVSVIDAASFRRIAAISVGRAPYALALSPDGGRLYVADVRSDDVQVLDTRRLARVATIPVGSTPYGVAVTFDGATALTTNQHAGTLSVIDAKTLTVVATIDVGRYPEGVICGPGGRAYVANWFSDDVSVVDLARRREIARLKVGDGPRAFAAVAGSR